MTSLKLFLGLILLVVPLVAEEKKADKKPPRDTPALDAARAAARDGAQANREKPPERAKAESNKGHDTPSRSDTPVKGTEGRKPDPGPMHASEFHPPPKVNMKMNPPPAPSSDKPKAAEKPKQDPKKK